MNTWNTLTIASLGKVVTGKTPPSAKPEQFGDKYPFVTPSDIKFGNKSAATERFLSGRGVEAHKRIQLPKKTVCVVCIGATIGKVCFTDQLSISNQQINSIIVDSKKHDPDFVFYIASLLRGTLEAYAGGAATPIVNKTAFSKIKLRVPNRYAQRKIAAILTAYDDLIEVNKRRIALLEKMAEELYREWFVRLRFPGYQGTRFVKGVPEGWEVLELKELVEDIIDYRGLTPKKLGGHWTDDGIIALSALNVKAGELIRLDDSKRVSETLYERWMRKRLQAHDILLTSEAPLGQVYFLVDSEQYVLSQRLFAVRANQAKVTPVYLYQYLRYPIGQGQLQVRATGSTVGGIRQALLKKVEVIVPTDTLMKKHEEYALPIKEEIHALWKTNNNLTKTRDLLLPRLISGKLSVEDLDIQFPPSMQEGTAEQESLAEARHA
ncbi:MAG: restriction endonuclease subunit S [Pseudomonadota bacterium]